MHFPQNVHEPRAKMATRDAVENFAEEVAHRYDFHQVHQPGYAPDKLHKMVLALIGQLGGRIFRGETPGPTKNRRDYSLVAFAMDDFIIAPFGSDWPALRKTQVVVNASELGHLFLHYPEILVAGGENAVMACPRHAEAQCEIEARWFAETLIFPRAAFQAAWDYHKGVASAIAHEYDVTERLVRARAERLGYILPEVLKDQMPSRCHRPGKSAPVSHVITL